MSSLPTKFAALEPFVASWSLETELQRSHRRWTASAQDYQDFYNAMLPILDDALTYLDQFKLGEIPENALALYHLTLAFAEAAPHYELYDCANEVPNSFAASRFVAAHGEQIDR